MDKLQDRFRSEVEHEMAARWLASSLAEWIETYHGEAAELLGHKRMDWVMSAAALGAHVAKDCAGQAPSGVTPTLASRARWRRGRDLGQRSR